MTNPKDAGQGDAPAEHVKHPEAGNGNLAAKLARITAGVGTLKKDGTVSGTRGFGYATIGAMSAAIAPLLGEEGVAILPVGVTVLESHPFQLDGDKYGWRWLTSIEVEWLITDGESQITARSLGKSVDSNGSEKDTNQAHTFARINLYKSLFHLSESGEDPEQKGRPRDAGGGSEWTGEVPSMEGATVSGAGVVVIGPGTVGLAYGIEPRSVQAEVNAIVRQLGGKWDKDAKHYAIPEANTALAVALARGVGMTIPDKVRERFPVTEAPKDPPPPDLPVASGGQSEADRLAAEQAGDAAFGGEQGTLGGTPPAENDPPD